MSYALGMFWLHHSRQYRQLLGQPVPDWICTLPMAQRVSLVRSALKLHWRLPQRMLVRNEFHDGPWSVWSS